MLFLFCSKKGCKILHYRILCERFTERVAFPVYIEHERVRGLDLEAEHTRIRFFFNSPLGTNARENITM